MKQFNDNDIEILGGSNPLSQRRHKPKKRHFVIAAIVIAITAGIIIMTMSLRNERALTAADIIYPTEITSSPAVPVESTDSATALPVAFIDSINDVAFTAIQLEGRYASVSFNAPDSLARDIVFAAPAADYRADNGEIVGEFIHDGKQLSRGIRKPGYCYISPEGTISIGLGEGDEAKSLAIKKGGTFFRQYALVMDGEIQPNILKGKAKRRAIGFIDGKPMAILSVNRESIYDFSQALADYGFSHAIYIPGGEGYLYINTGHSTYFNGDTPQSKHANYVIFNR